MVKENKSIASLILAAGRGSRMKDFNGNKTLLPLIRGESSFKGQLPILHHILENLPSGKKAIVVNHKKEDIRKATSTNEIQYFEQPRLNGTGGALLAAQTYIEQAPYNYLLVTMGDVPLVEKNIYQMLVDRLEYNSMVILGFSPEDKKQYGILEINGTFVDKIVEWNYWKNYPLEKQADLTICNSGIYAFRKQELVRCLPVLASRPHLIQKNINGQTLQIEEFFITDIVEYMTEDKLEIGYIVAENEYEVLGVDDISALEKAQDLYSKRSGSR